MNVKDKAYFDHLARRSSLSYWVRRLYTRDLVRQFSGRVLDVGCGMGEFLRSYQPSIGVDYNFHFARFCQANGASTNCASIFSLPYPDNTFAGVLVSNVLEHLEQPEAGLLEAVRVTQPGGRVVVTCPYEAGFRYDPTHLTFITPQRMRELATLSATRLARLYSFPPATGLLGKFLYFIELRAVFVKPAA